MREMQDSAHRWIIMGVAGCGKTTVGRLLAAKLRVPFFDADDFHTPANRAKMASGVPLTDDDRQPWLESLRQVLLREPNCVLACSALRASYRQTLSKDIVPPPNWVFLDAPRQALLERMQQREHFMPAALLDSQLATLEPPTPEEALRLDATQSAAELVAMALASRR